MTPKNLLSDAVVKRFTDEEMAREYMEAKRWPDGEVCPHCGEIGNAYKLTAKAESKSGARKGLWKCGGCRKQFSVTVGTVFEDSHIPMHKWMLAINLICASKKGMSAHQLFRMMGTFYGKRGSYKTAWFMFHRLRFAMTQHPFVDKLKGIVEIDETWVGPKERGTGFRGVGHPLSKKRPVVALMERNEGGSRVRSFPVERVTVDNVKPIMKAHVEAGTNIQTDEATIYHFMHDEFPDHDFVTHSRKEYSRYENGRHITSNTVEGYFGLFKRSIYGTYHHIGKGYMQQYLNEADFKYNTRRLPDAERVDIAIKATEAKRLTMRQPKSASA
jgi:transposase-like protein